SRTGLEESLNDYLTGSNANLDTLLNNTLDKLRGITQRGNDVITTIDVDGQRTAQEALAGQCGAAVALDPTTGKVLVWASQPTYNPNLVEGHFNQIQAKAAGAPCEPAAPLLDRVSQGLFIPGSTFKVVTAAAALDSGKVTPSTTRATASSTGRRSSTSPTRAGRRSSGRSRSPRRSRTPSTPSSARSESG